MKKLVIAVIALMTLSTVNAQEDEIRFGAKVGLNVAILVGDDVSDDLESKIGFHIGALAEIPLSDKFAVQPELVFSTQGAKLEESGYEFKANYNYLNLPVMAKYYVAEGFSIQAGPQIGFLMSAKQKEEYDDNDFFDDEEYDVKDDLKSVDFGLNFGVGYQLEQGIFFDALYNLGLSEIVDEGDADAKNAVFQISVGYKF